MNVVAKFFSKRGAHNVKFQTEHSKAVPGSSIATLGQKQVNMKQYCDLFNKSSLEFIENLKKKTKNLPISSIINVDELVKARLSVKMRIYDGKNWEIRIRNTTTANLIKMAIKLEKGCATAGKSTVASIQKSVLLEIAKLKLEEMNARTLDAAVKMLIGTTRSMGIEVKNDV